MKKIALLAFILPNLANAASFSCKAIQEGQIDSGSQKKSVISTLDVQERTMKVNLAGQSWRLGLIGQKSIAKMYATPDGGVAVTYIDNGSEAIFVLRPTNPDGQSAIYTLSECSENP